MAQYRDTKLAKAAKVVSFDAEKNTVKVLFYTGAYVERYRAAKSGWEKYFLGFDMDAIDASRFEKGVGLFLDHYTTIERQIGHSVPGTLEKTDAGYVATFELEDVSEFPPENTIRRAVEKLKDGLANEFSMGVDWDSQTEELKDGVAYVTATDWQPYEVSLVGVDADHGTTSLEKEGKMPEVTEKQGQVAPNEAELMREGARLERERAAGIEMLGKKFKVEELAAKHIKDGTDLATAREEILLAAQAKIESAPVPNPAPAALASSTVPVITVGQEAAEKVRAGIVEALAGQFGAKRPENNEFNGLTLMEMAEELAAARGERFRNRGALKAAIMNPRSTGLALTPSDFPVIIGEAANVYLMGQGVVEAQAFERIGTREDLPDMTAVKGVDTVFDVAVTKALAPGEKYPDAKMSESSETYRLEKKGAFLRITEEVLEAERVGAIRNGINQGVFFFRRLESQTFYTGLFGTDGLGPVMADGKKFFHDDHGNLASAKKFDAQYVEALMTLLRKQKKGKMALNLPAYALVVPAALELEAEKMIRGDFSPSSAAAAKLPRVRSLDIIVDSALDDITTTGYAVITDPRLITIASYGWKIGEEGVQLMAPVWDDETDTWRYKFKDRFGAAAMDYRGAAFNPGASS
jgi:hypothetical protein